MTYYLKHASDWIYNSSVYGIHTMLKHVLDCLSMYLCDLGRKLLSLSLSSPCVGLPFLPTCRATTIMDQGLAAQASIRAQ